MKENESKIKLPLGIDDLFTTQAQRDDAQKEKVEELDISLLDTFPNHPFKVIENDDFKKLQDSIKDNGILEPIIVRKKDNDRYEIISGHRRKKACELNGLKKIPCLIRNMSDDEATIYMVDSNMHREVILPSEKAFAYKMKLEAMKHQGIKRDFTSAPVGRRLEARDIIGDEVGGSRENIRRYIRLTELVPELLQFVDNSVLDETPCIALRPAVEISYLTRDEQLMLLDNIKFMEITPSHAQAIRMHKLSKDGKLDSDVIDEILSEEKPNQVSVIKINESKVRSIIPKNINDNNMEDFIIKAVEYYSKHLRERNSRER